VNNWEQFDGWCTARGIDAISLSADRACNVYLYALRENASEETLAEIEDALIPPVTAKLAKGVPAWYGDDDDAWESWSVQVG
jgi:hypothetical protein